VNEQEIGVGELLLAVRRELAALDYKLRAAGVPALLKLETVELEVSFTAARGTEGKGAVDLKVVTVGASSSRHSGEIQLVRLQYSVDPEALRAKVPGARGHRPSDVPDPETLEPLE
jgi:hypothetical protein